MYLRSFRVFWPLRFFVSFILLSIAISACATSPSSPVGVQTSPTTQAAKAVITWPFDPNDSQWAIVNGYRGNVDHALGGSPNNYALFAFDFAKCLPSKVNRGNGSCDLTNGWVNTVGATVYAPVSGTIAWPDDNCLGASINIDGYPGSRVVLFHIDPLSGTTWSQLAHSKPPKHFNQGDKIGTVSAGGCIGSGNHIHIALYSCTECVGDDGGQRIGHPFSDQWSIGGCPFRDDGTTLNEYLGVLVPCGNTQTISPTPTQQPNFSPFVGSWYAHSRYITINKDGSAKYEGRTFATCGQYPPPCDNPPQGGMHDTIVFTSVSGLTIIGTITSGTGVRAFTTPNSVFTVGSKITFTLQADVLGRYTLLKGSDGWLGCYYSNGSTTVPTNDPHYADNCMSGA